MTAAILRSYSHVIVHSEEGVIGSCMYHQILCPKLLLARAASVLCSGVQLELLPLHCLRLGKGTSASQPSIKLNGK